MSKAGHAGFTEMELEALRRKQAGEDVVPVESLNGVTLQEAELAEKEREFNEAVKATGGEVAELDWGTDEALPDTSALADIYAAAGASMPDAVMPSPTERVRQVGERTAQENQERMKEAEAAYQEAISPAPKKLPCLRCGYLEGEGIVDPPTKEDTVGFVRSILGGRRFVKTFTFFGDEGMSATFRSLLPSEYEVLRKVVQWMVRSGDLREFEEQYVFHQNATSVLSAVSSTTDKPDVVCKYPELDILKIYDEGRDAWQAAIKAVKERDELPKNRKRGPVPVVPPEPEELVYQAIHQRIREVGPTMVILTQGSYRMEELYKMLLSRAYDQNFWSGGSEQ